MLAASCKTPKITTGPDLSGKHFHKVFQSGCWGMEAAYSIYANDSIGTRDWNDGEGNGSYPMLLWDNDSLYSLWTYDKYGGDPFVKHIYGNHRGTYEYDEASHLFKIKGFSFMAFWKNLKEFEIISINDEEMKCKGERFRLVDRNDDAVKCLFIFKHYDENKKQNWKQKMIDDANDTEYMNNKQ